MFFFSSSCPSTRYGARSIPSTSHFLPPPCSSSPCASEDYVDSPPAFAYKNMTWTYVSFLVKVISEAVALPILPFFVTEDLGGTAEDLGYAISIFAFAQMCSSLLLGRLSDSIGRRKMLLFSYACNCIGFLLTIFSRSMLSLQMLYIARFTTGISGGAVTMIQAMVSDVCTLEKRIQYNGYLGAVLGIGFVFGPALGGMSKYFINERKNCFYVCFIGGIWAFIMALIGTPETLSYNKRRPLLFFFNYNKNKDDSDVDYNTSNKLYSDSGFVDNINGNNCGYNIYSDNNSYSKITNNYNDYTNGGDREENIRIIKYNGGVSYIGLLCVCLIRFFSSFAATVMGGTYFLLLRDSYLFQRPDAKVSLILTLSGVCMVIYQGYAFKKVVRLLGCYGTMYLGSALQAIGIFMSYYSTNYSLSVHTLAFCFAYSVAYSLIEPNIPTIAAFYGDQFHQGLIHGSISSCRFLATIVGPALYGIIYKIDPSFPFFLASIFSTLSFFSVFFAQQFGDVIHRTHNLPPWIRKS